MNKLLAIPLGFMIILTIISIVYSGTLPVNSINNTTIPGAESQEFDIWGLQGAMIILIAAVAVGTVAGISILGSGLSDTSQRIIFNSVLFVSLWAILTIVCSSLIFGTGIIFQLIWVIMTILFVIGLGSAMTGGNEIA
jgi:hypothetical protein